MPVNFGTGRKRAQRHKTPRQHWGRKTMRMASAVTALWLAAASAIAAVAQDYPNRFIRVVVGPGPAITTPFVLVVHPSVPARTVPELIALARSRPGALNYASSGIGTPPHLAGELFKAMAGLDIVHVPFREANSALNAVVSGAVPMMFSIASAAQPQIAAQTVRGLGVTAAGPSRLVPDLPAIAQSGLPGFEVIGWNGFVAPAGTPAPIVAKLNAALWRGLDDADVRKRLEAAGYEPAEHSGPDEFAAFIRADTEKWIGLVEQTNMRAR